MATHFICQSTEPLPHNYPTGAAVKSHGAVSQYEVYNAGRKSHTRFPPPGWDFSQTSEEDSLPLIHPAPEPEQKSTSFVYDTDLCVTPQRPTKCLPESADNCTYDDNIFKKPEVNPDPGLELTPMKPLLDEKDLNAKQFEKCRKQKVRFEIDNSLVELNSSEKSSLKKSSPNKAYKPELYEDDECDYEIERLTNTDKATCDDGSDHSRAVKYNISEKSSTKSLAVIDNTDASTENVNMKKLPEIGTTSTIQSIPKAQLQKSVKVVREKNSDKSQEADKTDPIATCWVHEKTGPKRKAKVLRDNQYTVGDEFTYPFKENPLDDYAGAEEHVFARPEYNSTLRMNLEAERLKESTVDIETALKRKLQLSDSVKAEMNEKVASLVNTEGPAFNGLISLNIPAEEICRQVVEQKTMRAKQVKFPKSKVKEIQEPDLMEFYSSERQKESVTFSLPGISAPSEQLSTASHFGAFDLYKHNRVWERSRKY